MQLDRNPFQRMFESRIAECPGPLRLNKSAAVTWKNRIKKWRVYVRQRLQVKVAPGGSIYALKVGQSAMGTPRLILSRVKPPFITVVAISFFLNYHFELLFESTAKRRSDKKRIALFVRK